jgi:hypothetical protein
MSEANLAPLIERLHANHLEAKGFALYPEQQILERRFDGLRQGIAFQTGFSSLEGKYTLNVYWSFLDPLDKGIEEDGTSMSAAIRIRTLAGRKDCWFAHEGRWVKWQFRTATKLIIRYALPYLDRYDSIANIVQGCSAGGLAENEAFGEDAGWRHYHQGFCYSMLGDVPTAIQHFSTVVESHSERPLEWVQQRKESAIEQLQLLGAQQWR